MRGPFTLRQALDAGLTKGQLRSNAYANPFRGVHIGARELVELHDRCAAASLALPEGTVFSHSTAAALRNLPAPLQCDRLEVCVRFGTTVPQRRGIRAHERQQLDAPDCVGGLRVSRPADIFIDLAERLTYMQLLALGDAILGRNLASAAELEHTVDRASRRRGVRLARQVLPVLDPRAESPMESYLRALLICGGFAGFEVNPNLYDDRGIFLARTDLLFRRHRVIVEYDGDHHRTDKQQFAADLARSALLQRHGYIVLRFSAVHIFQQPGWVLDTIGQHSKAAVISRPKAVDHGLSAGPGADFTTLSP